jgi:tetratricopeptide (TPR) repeat protein
VVNEKRMFLILKRKNQMKKSVILMLFAALFSVAAWAQNVQEGVAHLNAERYQSARGVFDKLVAANPNNLEAVYWLGQTMIEQGDVAAKALYDKTLATNGNAPLVLVGAGHVDLLQGRTAEARQRFEAGITSSRGKKGDDPIVINAIARANIDAKAGDVAYAISKLNAIVQANPNAAETYLMLGNAYRRMSGQGGLAKQNWEKAAQLNPALAAQAYYNIARLFRTQRNWEVVLENLNRATSADQRFAPAYERFYDYYLIEKKDFAKAEEYLAKYKSSADQTPEILYFEAQTDFLQKRYDAAITKAKQIIDQMGEKANPRIYKLLSYSYLEKGDTSSSCQYVNQYFAKAKEDNIIGGDYMLKAYSCGKGDPAVVRESVIKAVQMDSVLSRQVALLDETIAHVRKNQQKLLEGELMLISYELRGDKYRTPGELFRIGLPYYLGGNYPKADSLFTAYATALPDSIYGYYWSGLARMRIDTTLEQGLAVPMFEKTLQIAENDKVRYKSQAVQSATTLTAYHYNVKKDKTAALQYIAKGLEFDPVNATLLAIQKQLQAPARTTPSQNRPTQRTSTSNNSAKTGTTAKPKAKKG